MEEQTKVERIEVNVCVHPDWTGPRITTRKSRSKAVPVVDPEDATKTVKVASPLAPDGTDPVFTFSVPVPETDEQCKELYNVSLVEMIRKGVVQHAYGENNFSVGTLHDALEKGENVYGEEFLTTAAEAMKEFLFASERTKSSKVAVVKQKASQFDQIMSLVGSLTPEELAEKIAAMQSEE